MRGRRAHAGGGDQDAAGGLTPSGATAPPGVGDDVRPRGLANRATEALGWSVLNTVLSRIGTLGVGIALARLLGPQEFGTYAVAYVALVAVLSFNELGVSLAIVRWRGDPREIASTVTAISLVSSTLIAGAGYFLAPSFAQAMGDPQATPVVRLLGLSVIVSGAVATPAALMQRLFLQKRRTAIDQLNVWVGAATSISLAVYGTGAMSLAVGRLAGAVTSGLVFIAMSPLPYRVDISLRHVRPLLAFGIPLAGASIVVFAVGFVDQLVVGRLLGPTALGLYVLACNLSSWPVGILSLPLRNVAPAAFARMREAPQSMRSAFVNLAGLLAVITIPACLLLSGTSRALVGFVYGPEWVVASSALFWLGAMAALRIGFELSYDYLVVVGGSRSIFVTHLLTLVVLCPALIFGTMWFGIAGAAAAQVAVALVVMVPLYMGQLHRVGVSLRALMRRVFAPVVAGLMVLLLSSALTREFTPPWRMVLLSTGVTALIIAAMLFARRGQVHQLRAQVTESNSTPVAAL